MSHKIVDWNDAMPKIARINWITILRKKDWKFKSNSARQNCQNWTKLMIGNNLKIETKIKMEKNWKLEQNGLNWKLGQNRDIIENWDKIDKIENWDIIEN